MTECVGSAVAVYYQATAIITVVTVWGIGNLIVTAVWAIQIMKRLDRQ